MAIDWTRTITVSDEDTTEVICGKTIFFASGIRGPQGEQGEPGGSGPQGEQGPAGSDRSPLTDETYYVDKTNGDDTNTGRSGYPLKTIAKAFELGERSDVKHITIYLAQNDQSGYTMPEIKDMPAITFDMYGDQPGDTEHIVYFQQNDIVIDNTFVTFKRNLNISSSQFILWEKNLVIRNNACVEISANITFTNGYIEVDKNSLLYCYGYQYQDHIVQTTINQHDCTRYSYGIMASNNSHVYLSRAEINMDAGYGIVSSGGSAVTYLNLSGTRATAIETRDNGRVYPAETEDNTVVANRDYYIDCINGDDTNPPGYENHPVKTISKAIEQSMQETALKITFHVAAGVYPENVVLNNLKSLIQFVFSGDSPTVTYSIRISNTEVVFGTATASSIEFPSNVGCNLEITQGANVWIRSDLTIPSGQIYVDTGANLICSGNVSIPNEYNTESVTVKTSGRATFTGTLTANPKKGIAAYSGGVISYNELVSQVSDPIHEYDSGRIYPHVNAMRQLDIYVDSVEADGSGTILDPYGKIEDALAIARQDDVNKLVIHIAEGTYDEELTIDCLPEIQFEVGGDLVFTKSLVISNTNVSFSGSNQTKITFADGNDSYGASNMYLEITNGAMFYCIPQLVFERGNIFVSKNSSAYMQYIDVYCHHVNKYGMLTVVTCSGMSHLNVERAVFDAPNLTGFATYDGGVIEHGKITGSVAKNAVGRVYPEYGSKDLIPKEISVNPSLSESDDSAQTITKALELASKSNYKNVLLKIHSSTYNETVNITDMPALEIRCLGNVTFGQDVNITNTNVRFSSRAAENNKFIFASGDLLIAKGSNVTISNQIEIANGTIHVTSGSSLLTTGIVTVTNTSTNGIGVNASYSAHAYIFSITINAQYGLRADYGGVISYGTLNGTMVYEKYVSNAGRIYPDSNSSALISEYYVVNPETGSDDNTGRSGSPLKTIGKALTLGARPEVASIEIGLVAGTYDEQVTVQDMPRIEFLIQGQVNIAQLVVIDNTTVDITGVNSTLAFGSSLTVQNGAHVNVTVPFDVTGTISVLYNASLSCLMPVGVTTPSNMRVGVQAANNGMAEFGYLTIVAPVGMEALLGGVITYSSLYGTMTTERETSYGGRIYTGQQPILGPMATSDDAPEDSKGYLRKNGEWVESDDRVYEPTTDTSETTILIEESDVPFISEIISEIKPRQEGSGDPSPTNIRNFIPITDAEIEFSANGTSGFHSYYKGFPDDDEPIYGCRIRWGAKKIVRTWQLITYDGSQMLTTIWMSDRDVYAPNTTPTIGAKVLTHWTENEFDFDYTDNSAAAVEQGTDLYFGTRAYYDDDTASRNDNYLEIEYEHVSTIIDYVDAKATPIDSKTIYVSHSVPILPERDGSQDKPYWNIYDAIAAGKQSPALNVTIYVEAGTYTETVTFQGHKNYNLILQGDVTLGYTSSPNPTITIERGAALTIRGSSISGVTLTLTGGAAAALFDTIGVLIADGGSLTLVRTSLALSNANTKIGIQVETDSALYSWLNSTISLTPSEKGIVVYGGIAHIEEATINSVLGLLSDGGDIRVGTLAGTMTTERETINGGTIFVDDEPYSILDEKANADDVYDKTYIDTNKAPIIISSAFGAVASFKDGLAAPVSALKIGIEPVQSGSGDPAPDNVRAISGHTQANIYRVGEDISFNTIDGYISGTSPQKIVSSTTYKVAYIPVVSGKTYSARKTGVSCRWRYGFTSDVPANNVSVSNYVNISDALYVTVTAPEGVSYLAFYISDLTDTESQSTILSKLSIGEAYVVTIDLDGTRYGGTLDVLTGEMVVDYFFFEGTDVISCALNSTSASATVGRARLSDNNFPEAFLQTSNVNSTISISNRFSKNIPSGTAGRMVLQQNEWYFVVPTSELATVDQAGLLTWLTNNYTQVAYKMATPLVVQLDPSTLSTLLGDNVIWTDVGSIVNVEYRADTKLFIEKLTKPTEDDMIANANIASGKYFMVGNSLFYSTASIAAGDAIKVGTNCTALSFADALNNLNS